MIFTRLVNFFIAHFSENEPDLQHLVSFDDYDRISELNKIHWEVAQYYYFLLLDRFAHAMDLMHWHNDFYINVPYELNDLFGKIAKALETIESAGYERSKTTFVGVIWRPFMTLYQDQDNLRLNWRLVRKGVFSTLEELGEKYSKYNVHLHPYEIPQDMQQLFSDFDAQFELFKFNLQQYKVRVRSFSWDEVTGIFTIKNIDVAFEPKSQRKQVFSKLLENLGKKVALTDFSANPQNQAKVRTVINQIGQKFVSVGLGDIVVITASGDGGYTLTINQA